MTKILELQLQHPSNEHSGLISFRMYWFDLLAVQGTLKSLLQHHSSKVSILWHSAFFMTQHSHPYVITGKTIALNIWPLLAKWCLCFLTHCLGLSWFFFQRENVFSFHGCSHCLQWFWSPRKWNLSLVPLGRRRKMYSLWEKTNGSRVNTWCCCC